MCCVCIWWTTLIVLTTVRVFVAGTAGVTVTELQSGSVDGGQRSVPTNVEPLPKRRKLTEEVATDSNVYNQTQTVSISLAEYQRTDCVPLMVALVLLLYSLTFYCTCCLRNSLLAGLAEYQGFGLGLTLSTNVNYHPSNVFHVACVLCIYCHVYQSFTT